MVLVKFHDSMSIDLYCLIQRDECKLFGILSNVLEWSLNTIQVVSSYTYNSSVPTKSTVKFLLEIYESLVRLSCE